jgi:uncharacterized protein (TIGR01244 family)
MNRFMLAVLMVLGFTRALAASDAALLAELRNPGHPEAHRIVSGAIDASDLQRLRAAGLKHVINLRTPEETPAFNEARMARVLDLDYHAIPIKGPTSLTRENAARLDDALRKTAGEPTLIHCASANRVGALIALRAAWIQGAPVDAAIAEGKRWGLTTLEVAVRQALESEKD